MKIHLLLSLMLAMVFAFAGCSDQTAETNQPQKATDKAAASNESSEKEIIIDVRSQEEWDSGHLERAILIPHTEIGDKIAEVTEDKSAKLVLYCKAGGRAGTAKEALEAMGYTNVENAGGFDDIKKRYAK